MDAWSPGSIRADLDRLAALGGDSVALASVVEPECDRIEARLREDEATGGIDGTAVAWVRELASIRGRLGSELPTGRSGSDPDGIPEIFRSVVGHPAQAVLGDMIDVEGRPVTWASARGKVVVLTAWGLWCGPCRSHEQDLRDVLRRVGSPTDVILRIVHVHRGRERDDPVALDWLRAVGLPPFTRIPADDFDTPTLSQTSATAIPHTIIVGRDGTIESVGVRGRALEVPIRRALARRGVAKPVAREVAAVVSELQMAYGAGEGLQPFFDGLGMRFVLIPHGMFVQRGQPVRLSKPFYLQTTEVTNEQFRRFRPEHRSGTVEGVSLDGDLLPVTNVRRDDARAYAAWLTGKMDGRATLMLPTQAQWEFAAKAATTTRFPWGDTLDPARPRANLRDAAFRRAFGSNDQTRRRTTPAASDAPVDDGFAAVAPVATFSPNPWGLFDMIGNVGEWTEDEPPDEETGSPAPPVVVDPRGPVNDQQVRCPGRELEGRSGGCLGGVRGGGLPSRETRYSGGIPARPRGRAACQGSLTIRWGAADPDLGLTGPPVGRLHSHVGSTSDIDDSD